MKNLIFVFFGKYFFIVILAPFCSPLSRIRETTNSQFLQGDFWTPNNDQHKKVKSNFATT